MIFFSLFEQGSSVFSFEFFLPKNPQEDASFKSTVRELKSLNPSFVTLTYGAGGSDKDRTLEMAGALKNEIGIETAAHLTCITHTRPEIQDILRRIRSMRIENIVALRGDPPKDGSAQSPQKRDYRHAKDLVTDIRNYGEFCVGVAGYPEGHPEGPSLRKDILHLKEKLEAGGQWVITQLFFKNKDYFDFVNRCRSAGIRAPIVPGIMPITSFRQIQRFTSLCGAHLPEDMIRTLQPVQDDKKAVTLFGIEYAFLQCKQLLENGAPGIHFYTLNKSHSTQEILRRLRKL